MPDTQHNRSYLHRWLDYLLPAYCILCGLYCGSRSLCQPCSESLPRPVRPCRSCAISIFGSGSNSHKPKQANEAAPRCGACLRHMPPWDEAMAGLVYEYPINQLVQRFKFRHNRACGQLLADELLRALRDGAATRPDVIIPVPLHYTRFFSRGFNQAEFLARSAGAYFKIPVLINRLRRTRKTTAQSGLNHKERRRNISGAFTCNELSGASVALVDDVLTTGTTLQACTKSALLAGASSVSIWVAARVPTPA